MKMIEILKEHYSNEIKVSWKNIFGNDKFIKSKKTLCRQYYQCTTSGRKKEC